MYTPEEQKEHRNLWIQALRSGEYQQTYYALRNESGFSALGVACDISDLGQWTESPRLYESQSFQVSNDDNSRINEDVWLPSEVRDWLGLFSDQGIFYTAKLSPELKHNLLAECNSSLGEPLSSLAYLNDAGCSFQQIAGIVEEAQSCYLVAPLPHLYPSLYRQTV